MGTIIIASVIAVILGLAIFSIIRDKKAGKSSCGCGCESCAARCNCSNKQKD